MKRITVLAVPILAICLVTLAIADTIPRGETVPQAFAARLNESGMEYISDKFEEYIYTDLEDLMREQLPLEILDEGCIWAYTAYITQINYITMDWPLLSVDAGSDGKLHFNFYLSNFHMDFVL